MSTAFPALDALYPLAPEELFRQWVLTKDPAHVPPQWQPRHMHGWCLAAHPDAHVCTLQDRRGVVIGWIIEPLAQLGPGGDVLPKQAVTLPVAADGSAAAFEQAFYGRDEAGRSDGSGLAGTWVAIVLAGQEGAPLRRVYLSASHSVMFSRERRTVATSHNLMPQVQRDEALSAAFNTLETRLPFTFGLTAFRELHRLLPNHYLDLDTFQPSRHWPLDGLKPRIAGEAGAARVVEHARRLLDVLAREYAGFRVLLSAGRDSRAMLALLQPHVNAGGDVRLATSYGSDLGSRIDLQCSRRLARIAGLPHDAIRRPPYQPDQARARRSFVRIGEAMAGKSLSLAGRGERKPYDPAARFDVAGMGGETARAFYWERNLPESPMTPELLVRQVRSPAVAPVLDAAAAWLDGLPPELRARPADVLDLAYIEQRLGCWQAPQIYLYPGRANPHGPSRLSTSPMVAALALEIMLRLPQAYRAEGGFQADMVAIGWPELLKVPFNTPRGWLRLRSAKRSLGRRLRR